MKTIFYISCIESEAQYWYLQNPFKEWFTLDNILYQPDGNVCKKTTIASKHTVSNKSLVDIAIINTTDYFTNDVDCIVRRIVMYIPND